MPKLRHILQDWGELRVYGRAWRVKPNAFGYVSDNAAFNPGQAHFDRVEVVFSRLTLAQQREIYRFTKRVLDGTPHPRKRRLMKFEDVDQSNPALLIAFYRSALQAVRTMYWRGD